MTEGPGTIRCPRCAQLTSLGDAKACLRNKAVIVCRMCAQHETAEEAGAVSTCDTYRELAYWKLPTTPLCIVLLSDRLLILSEAGLVVQLPLESVWARMYVVERNAKDLMSMRNNGADVPPRGTVSTGTSLGFDFGGAPSISMIGRNSFDSRGGGCNANSDQTGVHVHGGANLAGSVLGANLTGSDTRSDATGDTFDSSNNYTKSGNRNLDTSNATPAKNMNITSASPAKNNATAAAFGAKNRISPLKPNTSASSSTRSLSFGSGYNSEACACDYDAYADSVHQDLILELITPEKYLRLVAPSVQIGVSMHEVSIVFVCTLCT
jgi:hypothetical protein